MADNSNSHNSSNTFRLLDLPPELQLNVYEKFYEGPYTLKAQRALGGGISWLGSPPLALLLTSRDVYQRALPCYRNGFTCLDLRELNRARAKKWFGRGNKEWILSVAKEISFDLLSQKDYLYILGLPFTRIQKLTFWRLLGVSTPGGEEEQQEYGRSLLQDAKLINEELEWVEESVVKIFHTLSASTQPLTFELKVIWCVYVAPDCHYTEIVTTCACREATIVDQKISDTRMVANREIMILGPHCNWRRHFYDVVHEVKQLRQHERRDDLPELSRGRTLRDVLLSGGTNPLVYDYCL